MNKEFGEDERPITNAELRRMFHSIGTQLGVIREEIRIMAENQIQADQDNATAFAALAGVINQYVTAVAALLAQQASATADPVVISTTASMQALTTTLQADLAALTPTTTTTTDAGTTSGTTAS